MAASEYNTVELTVWNQMLGEVERSSLLAEWRVWSSDGEMAHMFAADSYNSQ